MAQDNKPAPMPDAQRKLNAQAAKHAGDAFYIGQRVVDLVTKREGVVLANTRGAEREDLSYLVQLDAVPFKPDPENQPFEQTQQWDLLSSVKVVRKVKELCAVPTSLKDGIGQWENPKL